MTTPDPKALYAACQRLERATGREIVPEWLDVRNDGTYYRIGETTDDTYYVRNDEAALDILEARLWRAVREAHASLGWYTAWDSDGVYTQRRLKAPSHTTKHEYPDLPAAAHAIAEFVMSQKGEA